MSPTLSHCIGRGRWISVCDFVERNCWLSPVYLVLLGMNDKVMSSLSSPSCPPSCRQGQGQSHHFVLLVNSILEKSPPCQPPMRKARTRRTLACAAPSCLENAVCPDATNAWFSSEIQVLVNWLINHDWHSHLKLRIWLVNNHHHWHQLQHEKVWALILILMILVIIICIWIIVTISIRNLVTIFGLWSSFVFGI